MLRCGLLAALLLAAPPPASAGEDPLALERRAVSAFAECKRDEAIALLERALAEAQATHGQAHPTVALLLSDLGEAHRVTGALDAAERELTRAVALREQLLGAEHADFAVTLSSLGALRVQRADYTGAAELFERARTILARKPDLKLARLLSSMAGLELRRSRLAEAEPLYREALALARAGGESSDDYAIAASNLAGLAQARGDLASAEAGYREGLAILEKNHGADHCLTAVAAGNLATVYAERGDHGRAEPLYQRADLALLVALGAASLERASVLNNLAELSRARGDVTLAVTRFEEVLALFERALGPEHPEVARQLQNLALALQQSGALDRAEPLYRRALSIRERTLGPEHPDVAIVFGNLGTLERERGRTGEAAKLQERAAALFEKSLGPDHPALATALCNRAEIMIASGAFAQAAPLVVRAGEIRARALGAEHPAVAEALDLAIDLRWAAGEVAEAIRLAERAEAIRDRHAARAVAFGSERERRVFALGLDASTARAVSLHAEAAPEDDAALALALRTVLRRKGIVIDAMARSLAHVRSIAETSEGEVLLRMLAERRNELSQLGLRSVTGNAGARELERMQELTIELGWLEGKAGELAGAAAALEPVEIAAVQQALPPRALLIELVRYHPHRLPRPGALAAPEPERYLAYVLGPSGAPRWAALGAAAPIDEMARRLRAALADPRRDPAPLARRLHRAVIAPLEPLLGDAQHLLVAPDGELALVPFGVLVDAEGRYLMRARRVSYLTSGRDLVSLAHPLEPGAPAVVLGAPAFGSGAAKLRFGALPGTADEAKAIAALFGEHRLLLGADASERTLKAVARPALLHLATHGFFLSEARGAGGGGRAVELVDADGPTPPDPLLASGLALAGANDPAAGGEDGLLSAAEASALDLRGTRLVVLSACETGLGRATSGEGVLGLRRALRLAGAQSLLMTLWKVEDTATRDLMVAYYRELSGGGGRAEALRRAQLAMASDPARSHPVFWASFVLDGDWRSLGGDEVPLSPAPPLPRPTVAPPPGGGCTCRHGGGARRPPGLLAWATAWGAGLALSRRRRFSSARTRRDDSGRGP